jgi:hypothetical protein
VICETSWTSNSDDRFLMELISERWGALISRVCRSSSVPPEFLAALVANESAGEAAKERFHEGEYEQLLCARNGNGLHRFDAIRNNLHTLNEDQLVECATSWGLTQVMGYQVLSHGSPPCRLLVPEFNLVTALQCLAIFSEECLLDVRAEFPDMFRCWAAGRPDGVPADPSYVGAGMRRLTLYRELTAFGLATDRMAA